MSDDSKPRNMNDDFPEPQRPTSSDVLGYFAVVLLVLLSSFLLFFSCQKLLEFSIRQVFEHGKRQTERKQEERTPDEPPDPFAKPK